MPHSRSYLHGFLLAAFCFAFAGCGERTDNFQGDGELVTYCRDHPEDCDGDIGGSCRQTEDCSDGVCCTEKSNCAGGMCLYRCKNDSDCPDNQRCEHDHCFFTCNSDSDCGRGQSCEHGNTICEYD